LKRSLKDLFSDMSCSDTFLKKFYISKEDFGLQNYARTAGARVGSHKTSYNHS